ncbi:LytR/AlgR family response regulator transcription factor [Brevundimonas sp. R86498]|uniref:LytR/AlgR family response regulator transcription factor n=1 Tax=Brevundimonas sp. R86498 TaxID=3093845 RepID=UPI0037CB6DEE
MIRAILMSLFLICLPGGVAAQVWSVCPGAVEAFAPDSAACRPVEGVIDPQGRELWLRADIDRPAGTGPQAFYVGGIASSEVWLNGVKLGANGQPGASAAAEEPGRYEAAFPIEASLWRATGNGLVVRMSSFHGGLRLDGPVGGMGVAGWPPPSRAAPLALTFLIAGALFAAAFGFGVIHALRRTGSSLILTGMAGVAGAQAVLETLRTLVNYPYPLHVWRLVGIWGLTAVFAVLLVGYVAGRFWPGARRALIGVALAGVVGSLLIPGFDLKTAAALMVGVGLAAVAAAVAVRRGDRGARLTLAYLVAFVAVGVAMPRWLVDLSYFVFAAGLVLPLLMAELIRLGRDDRAREAVLTQAAARPDCLTVASARGLLRVPLAQIIAVVGADDYVELRLADGRRLLHAARLDRLETELPGGFLRVHRSVIANLAHVQGYARDGGRGRLLMGEGEPLPISRNRLAAVRDALEGASLTASVA